MALPTIGELKSRVGRLLGSAGDAIKSSYNNDASALGIARNTVTGLPSAARQVLSQGPGEALSNSYQGIARNPYIGTAVRLPEELFKTTFSGTSKFVNTSGKLMGEGLAYATDPNVRKQYLAGNTNVLPTLTNTTLPKLFGQGAQSALELAPMSRGGAAVKKILSPITGKLTMSNPSVQAALMNIGKGTGAGYGFDVAANLGEGKTGPEAFKPGLGTLIGGGMSALPVIGAGLSSKEKLGGFARNPLAGEPKIDDFPMLSGRTPIAGVNDTRQSALQTSRMVKTGKGKAVMVTGAPEDLVGSTANITDMGKGKKQVVINRDVAPVNAEYKTTLLLPPGETPAPLLRLPSGPNENTPMTSFQDVTRAIYKMDAYKPKTGGKTGVGVIGDAARGVENRVDAVVSHMLSSENPVLRTIGNTLRGFAGSIGKTKALTDRTAGFHGQSDFGTKMAEDFQRLMPSTQKEMDALLSHLDPEITGGITKPLSAKGQEQLAIARIVSDFINDTNFKNGFVTKEQWSKNRGGRYIARAYDSYDMPPEIADFMKTSAATAKMDLNPFKKRGELTDWKMEHAIRDPGYLLGKRLQQTMFNDSTKGMFDWLSGQRQYVSDTARGGYSKISEHPAYGSLSGKYVRKDVMEGIRGLYFEHETIQKLYDGLKAWDNNVARRTLKKGMTVYNPVVRAGNVMGNTFMSHMMGVNPVTFAKEFASTPTLVRNNTPLSLRMAQEGILGSGVHRGDIVKYAEELKQGVQDQNTISKIDDMVSKSYGETDDRAKYVAMKLLLKDGVSWDEAKFRVMSGFQNYHNVGFLYDIGSKLPILGNPFVRFQASMMTILKNAGRDHPLRAIGTAMAFKYFQDVMSRVSGETPEDREVRENRVGAPHFPFTNMSLTIQTPYGEVNPARMIGMYSGNPVGGASVSSDLSRVMPIQSPRDARNYGSDPLAGPLISTFITDKNFQNKSISDPEQTKFKPSTLTDSEKNVNRVKFIQRAYTPSFINSLTDVGSSLKGEEDFYGRTRSPLQAISSAAGVKIEQYGPKEAQAQRMKDLQGEQYKKDDIKRGVNAVTKEMLTGKIDSATAQARIQNLTNGLSSTQETSALGSEDGIAKNPMGGYSYIDENGDLKKADTLELAKRAKAKIAFKSSGKDFQEYGDRVFRLNEDGSVSDVSKYKYQSQLLGAQLTEMKDIEDYQGWFQTARQQYQNYEKQLENSSVDPAESQAIKNQMHALLKKAALYSRYGGFKKPKSYKGKKIKFKTSFKPSTSKSLGTTKPIKPAPFKPLNFSAPNIEIKPYRLK